MVLIVFTASCPKVDCKSWKVTIYHKFQPHKNSLQRKLRPVSNCEMLFRLREATVSKYTANGNRVYSLSIYQRKANVLAAGAVLTSIVTSPETNHVLWIF
jgi:hypothetical protein